MREKSRCIRLTGEMRDKRKDLMQGNTLPRQTLREALKAGRVQPSLMVEKQAMKGEMPCR